MPAPAPILVLQHIGCEPPGTYGEVLEERDLPFRCVRPDAGEELPSWEAFAGILAMGGPMGTYEEEVHQWLAAEKQLIADAVRAGTPYWGVCLGAQLLAASLGGEVMPGELPEVGVGSVWLTDHAHEDPVFSSAPTVFDALHWHGDTYELPSGASRLAGSAQYEQQAFVYERAYGLQFHLEVAPGLAQEWIEVPAYADSLEQVMGAGGASLLLERMNGASLSMATLARTLFGSWLDHVVQFTGP